MSKKHSPASSGAYDPAGGARVRQRECAKHCVHPGASKDRIGQNVDAMRAERNVAQRVV